MKFTVGRIEPGLNLDITEYDVEALDYVKKTIPFDSIREENIQLLTFDSEVRAEISDTISGEEKFYPCIELAERFPEDVEEAYAMFSNIHSKWILKNNLTLIEEIFSTTSYLRDLWKKNRDQFFEELWFLLRNNLGTTTLRLIFNDLFKEGDKKKLVRSTIYGEKLPELTPAGESEESLFANYSKGITSTFDIIEYFPEKGELVIGATIEKGPILIMCKLHTLNQLQNTVIKTLITGIDSELSTD